MASVNIGNAASANAAGSGLGDSSGSTSIGNSNGQGIAFATLQPKFSDCSAQLVELMRATLRHAQEIGAAVGEAEGAAERARATVAETEAAATAQESRVVDAEIKRLQAARCG